jgi:hypothetical protein
MAAHQAGEPVLEENLKAYNIGDVEQVLEM